MAKRYNFNMERNGHNIDSAMVMLRNRAYEAEKAGDMAAAARLLDRERKLSYIVNGCFNGLIKVTWDEWQMLKAASDWAREHRMMCCWANGIEYVE